MARRNQGSCRRYCRGQRPAQCAFSTFDSHGDSMFANRCFVSIVTRLLCSRGNTLPFSRPTRLCASGRGAAAGLRYRALLAQAWQLLFPCGCA